MGLAVTDAKLDGTTVGLRCEDGKVVAIGRDVVAAAGDEVSTPAGRRWFPGSSTPTRTPG